MLDHLHTASLPGLVARQSGSGITGKHGDVIQAGTAGRLQIEDCRVEPDDSMVPASRPVETWPDRLHVVGLRRDVERGLPSQKLATRRRAVFPPPATIRVQRLVERREPATVLVDTHRSHHQPISGPRGCDVCDTIGFFPLGPGFFLAVIEQIPGRTPQKRLSAETSIEIQMAVPEIPACEGGRRVSKNHDRELQSFRLVGGHQLHARRVDIEEGRFRRVAAGFLIEVFDE